MPVITIPFDYDERIHPTVVPICIDNVDAKGNEIHPDWFYLGVAPVADNLRRIATRVLRDVWRVSEITELAVHAIWRTHGADLGTNPELVICSQANWCALDLKAGGRRARRGTEVELFAETLDLLRDQLDLIKEAEISEILEKLVAQASELAMHEVVAMVPMMLRGCDAAEYIKRFGKKRNTLTQMFFRHMRKAADAAGLTF